MCLSDLKYATVYCQSRSDGRKPVWMNTDKGMYALNGQSIGWVQKAESIGVPLVGSDGSLGSWGETTSLQTLYSS